ncbi:MAG: peptidylprolyl isomerase [Deltaproteobacteria bacterium]|nr:peptidylprolyl isomerase [Deltaproteobacteria bacterium]
MAEKKKSPKSKADSPTKSTLKPETPSASKRAPEPETANYLVPALLGLAVVVSVGVWAKTNVAPPEPAAVQWANDPPARPAQPSANPQGSVPEMALRGSILPTPERAPPGADTPIEPAHREPSSPDPRAGRFTLADATQGMSEGDTLRAEIETNYGTFNCQLLPAQAPNSVANFVGLARGNRPFWDPVAGAWATRPYFDGTVFHRVIPGFMIQGGDILRSGHGGPGYEFADENTQGHTSGGLLCMANHGPNTNGSQFFITEEAKPHLDGSYSIFGRCDPVALVRRISSVERGPSDRPAAGVIIRHVRIAR